MRRIGFVIVVAVIVLAGWLADTAAAAQPFTPTPTPLPPGVANVQPVIQPVTP